MKIDIRLLTPSARIPTRANAHDAGHDLYSAEEVRLVPGQRALIKTGISMAIPSGYYGRVAPRSGLAVKHGLDVLAGVVDATYRGEVMVALINLGQETVDLLPGTRVAQLIIEACYPAEWQTVDVLPETARAEGGFGSSGV
jgi:deoxyuridine 5'-triphosphate nucleotidohydrolase